MDVYIYKSCEKRGKPIESNVNKPCAKLQNIHAHTTIITAAAKHTNYEKWKINRRKTAEKLRLWPIECNDQIEWTDATTERRSISNECRTKTHDWNQVNEKCQMHLCQLNQEAIIKRFASHNNFQANTFNILRVRARCTHPVARGRRSLHFWSSRIFGVFFCARARTRLWCVHRMRSWMWCRKKLQIFSQVFFECKLTCQRSVLN